MLWHARSIVKNEIGPGVWSAPRSSNWRPDTHGYTFTDADSASDGENNSCVISGIDMPGPDFGRHAVPPTRVSSTKAPVWSSKLPADTSARGMNVQVSGLASGSAALLPAATSVGFVARGGSGISYFTGRA